MSEILALICYMLGDWISRSPLCNFRIGAVIYQKLMLWSCDLDKKEKIWKTPNE